jgi:hypothetical protein
MYFHGRAVSRSCAYLLTPLSSVVSAWRTHFLYLGIGLSPLFLSLHLLVPSLLRVCLNAFGSHRDFILTTCIAHVSRDGRDLVVLSEKHCVVSFETLGASAVERPPSNVQELFWAFDQRIYVMTFVTIVLGRTLDSAVMTTRAEK